MSYSTDVHLWYQTFWDEFRHITRAKHRRLLACRQWTTMIWMLVLIHNSITLSKKHFPKDICAEDRLTKIQPTSRPDKSLSEIRSKMSKHSQREARRQRDTENPKLEAAPDWDWTYYIDSDDKEFDIITNNAKQISSAIPLYSTKKQQKEDMHTSIWISWRRKFMQKHSWRKRHTLKKKNNPMQNMFTKQMLTSLGDAVLTKATSTSTKSTLQSDDTTPRSGWWMGQRKFCSLARIQRMKQQEVIKEPPKQVTLQRSWTGATPNVPNWQEIPEVQRARGDAVKVDSGSFAVFEEQCSNHLFFFLTKWLDQNVCHRVLHGLRRFGTDIPKRTVRLTWIRRVSSTSWNRFRYRLVSARCDWSEFIPIAYDEWDGTRVSVGQCVYNCTCWYFED